MLYFVFVFNSYYPGGGMNDCVGVYTEPRKAYDRAQKFTSEYDFVRIEAVAPDGAYNKVWDMDTPDKNNDFERLAGVVVRALEEGE